MPGRPRSQSDVGAVVLTLGERTTGRALASLRAQTLPIAERVVVAGAEPFHRAFNLGVDRVASPYFVQVDADMVLDADAVASLRRAMAPGVGIAVGALRDPLVGRISGVKLFRRECCRDLRLHDTLAPEVAFYSALRERGWETAYLATGPLGSHAPDYGPDYVYGMYSLLGARYAARDDPIGVVWRLGALRRSSHALAVVGRLALGHGLFARHARDVPRPRPTGDDSDFLAELVAARDEGVPERRLRSMLSLDGPFLLAAFRELGASLRAAPGGARGWLVRLGELDGPRSLLAEIALAHGALAPAASELEIEPTLAWVRERWPLETMPVAA